MVMEWIASVTDRATVLAIAARGWNVLAGLLTMVVISWRFSPELQGYYFTFASVLTFQTFLELGFGTVIQQFVSHEWAHLSVGPRGRIQGEETSLQRLASLGRLAFHWYASAAVLTVVGVGIGGFLYFQKFSGSGSEVAWEPAWWTVCVLTGAVLLLTPAVCLLEGCNRVSSVYGLQLVQAVVSRTSLWVAMILGGGLWALSAGKMATFAVGVVFLVWKFGAFFRNIFRGNSGAKVNWRREVWPLQWRIAASWLGGYLLFSMFSPILFAFHGPVVAGQMGMTLALVGALTSVCYAVVGTRVPRFAMAVARRDYRELDHLFQRATALAVSASGVGGLALWTMLYGLRLSESPLAERFLPPLETGLLLLTVVLHQVRHSMGSYMRAHKKEPYVALSVVEALGAAIGLSVIGARYGARGLAMGFLLMSIIMIFPAVTIFRRFREQWHEPLAPLERPRHADGVVS